MTEIKYIQSTMTENSLIIIDELCRSTAVEEGTALAMSICENLAKSKAYVFVTTHYTLLTRLADMYLNIKVWQMEAIPSGDFRNMANFKLDFKFSLVPGVTSLKGYGFYMVRNGFPRTTLKYAQELLRQLPEEDTHPVFCNVDAKMRLKYQLECKLRKLKDNNKLTVTEINNQLNQYQEELKNIGEDVDENDDNVMQELSDIDHSIFDAAHFEPDGASNLQNSKVFLSDFKSKGHLQSAETSQIIQNSDQHVSSPSRNNSTFNESECSLNLTQNAIGLFGATSDRQNDSFAVSQMSEGQLSQEFRWITENRTPVAHPQGFISNSVPLQMTTEEDSFIKLTNYNFSLPLNYDRTKTSTPIVKDLKENPIHLPLNSSSVAILSPKVNITVVSGNVDDVDMKSVQEDMENFALEIMSGNVCFEEDFEMDNHRNSQEIERPIVQIEDAGKSPIEDEKQCINADEMNKKELLTPDKLQLSPRQHIFPITYVIEGPNNPTPSSPPDLSEYKSIQSSPSISYSPLASAPEENNLNVGKTLKEDIIPPLEKSIKVEPYVISSQLEKSIKLEITSASPVIPVLDAPRELQESVKVENISQTEMQVNTFLENFDQINGAHIYEEAIDNFPPERVSPLRCNAEHSQYSTAEGSEILNKKTVEKKINIIEDKIVQEPKSSGFKKRKVTVKRPKALGMRRLHKNTISEKPPKLEAVVESTAENRIFEPDAKRTGSQNGGGENTEPKSGIQEKSCSPKSVQKEKSSTSISEASKLRNLEGNGSTSSTSNGAEVIVIDEHLSLSEASKKRKLDEVTSSSEFGKIASQDNSVIDPHGSADSTVSDNLLPPKTKPKNVSNILKKQNFKKKFVPPMKKINIKEVKRQYIEQDKQWLENVHDSTDCEKLWKQRLNRPSLRQIKQIECVATLVKTNEGVEVIPAVKKTVRTYTKRSGVQKFASSSQSSSINMSMFSDKNAKSFDAFINSDRRDYRSFPFGFGLQENEPKDGNLFNFQRDDAKK